METLSSFSMIIALAIALICLIHHRIMMTKVPQSVPWAGVRNEILSKTRANVRELTAGLGTLKMGYNQFNRKGLPWVIPDPGLRPIVMLPQEHIAWMIEQPDSVLSARKPQVARFGLNYLCPALDFNHDAFMMDAVRKDLTRNLGRMQPAIIEDIRGTIDQELGLDTESWNEVCIKKAMDKVFFTSTSQLLVGSPLCRNEDYLHYSIGFATWLGAAAILVGQYTPKMLKPFFGYLGALPVSYRSQRALKFLLPVIRDRISNITRKRTDPSFHFEEPKDLITWMVKAMLDHDETKNNPPEFLGTRLLFFVRHPHNRGQSRSGNTLGGMHTSVMTATNILLDLVSANPDARYWEQLREEATGIFKTANDWTNPTSIPKLSLADSTVRESLRKNPMLTRTLLREVVLRDGVTLPSGHHIPKGAWLSTSTVDVHHDDRFYFEPNEYDPFRFARPREDMLRSGYKENLTDKASIYCKHQGLSTVSDIFLAFGYGKHACPGRWLVAHQLKLIIAYLTLNYDIQHIAKRPMNFVFGDSFLPPPTATMKVRRRRCT